MVSIFSHDVHHYTHNFVTTALPTSQLATHGHYVSYDQLVSTKNIVSGDLKFPVKTITENVGAEKSPL